MQFYSTPIDLDRLDDFPLFDQPPYDVVLHWNDVVYFGGNVKSHIFERHVLLDCTIGAKNPPSKFLADFDWQYEIDAAIAEYGDLRLRTIGSGRR